MFQVNTSTLDKKHGARLVILPDVASYEPLQNPLCVVTDVTVGDYKTNCRISLSVFCIYLPTSKSNYCNNKHLNFFRTELITIKHFTRKGVISVNISRTS